MTLVCRPVGRGNWKESTFQIAVRHGAPMLVAPGARFALAGVIWRVVRVET